MHTAEEIYDTLTGELIDSSTVPGVENLFATGSPCDRNYTRMLEAYGRLLNRLHQEDDDEDIEIIIDALLKNQEIIGMKMFEYGKREGQ